MAQFFERRTGPLFFAPLEVTRAPEPWNGPGEILLGSSRSEPLRGPRSGTEAGHRGEGYPAGRGPPRREGIRRIGCRNGHHYDGVIPTARMFQTLSL